VTTLLSLHEQIDIAGMLVGAPDLNDNRLTHITHITHITYIRFSSPFIILSPVKCEMVMCK
jgi:hypothetical protein